MSHNIFDLRKPGEETITREAAAYVEPVREVVPAQTAAPQPALFSCPDCSHRCSQYAEVCPGCGRFFRAYSRKVIPGGGWIAEVAWGIVLSSFLWGAILTMLFMVGVVLLVVLFGAGVALAPRQ